MNLETLEPYLNYIYAALGLLAILIIAVLLTRMVGGRIRGRRGSRLAVSEYYEIDKIRRLVLVRRDDVEHLILTGGGQDVVIEAGIGHAAAAKTAEPKMFKEAAGKAAVPLEAPEPPESKQPEFSIPEPVETGQGDDPETADTREAVAELPENRPDEYDDPAPNLRPAGDTRRQHYPPRYADDQNY